ncbi:MULTISPECIES: ATP-grasp domain-containing protein [unclassified Methanoculleus]|uniref:ATP-grasp domain-containing protein n=1 Tax=unclassified Methanoculleus TaxID=2619537 RepID=UPI0025E29DA5|nr:MULTISPECIES: ATP-grasp domain-containing protein [unclassified Methanoculleus]MCK9318481.1 ATP-grasp domain-containing protein [Methanoculleus sp.]MDD2254345.1 ATP-grasp domain-containing protein [Methanoculleus sp.]MDD2788001.1 ATP-grasp domain-containing protein [Methanoculleus sp.]MDD3216720.1 ATP-grasp domain-containing protein [Methanoculleus sp.]MDD4313599.1 ATP-grasp domain-containing protein [Methanoculleus sp.]
MTGRVLVAGFATRHVAQSARRAGYTVYAVDHFCDQDLAWCTEECLGFDDLAELPEKIAELAARHPVDALVVASGAETIGTTIPLCGTPPAKVERFLDKLEIQRFFERLDVPVPPLAGADHYPMMVKPRRGAGGWRNAVVKTAEELRRWEEAWPDVPYVAQQLVDGIPSSVSCVADGRRARAVAVNRQILRGEGESAHGFAGSVTPFAHPLAGEMIAAAERIAAASGCVGSVGIDFMAGERPWTIEINPRFQATVDTVEMATGQNVFAMHMDACRGIIPAAMPAARQVAVRRILFAERDMQVDADLAPLAPRIADIPWPGTEFEEGHAVVSVYGVGQTEAKAAADLEESTAAVRRLLGE